MILSSVSLTGLKKFSISLAPLELTRVTEEETTGEDDEPR